MSRELYLGFDLSTQQIKCCALDSTCQLVTEVVVDFENDLPQYETSRGYYARVDGSKVVVAPVAMWLEAIELTFERLKAKSLLFHNVRGISGDAQQHGTVYWNKPAAKVLASLDPTKTLKAQLNNCFSKLLSPIWMDFSTTSQCETFRKQFGEENVLEITGSVPTERFGGPQILRVIENEQDTYNDTDHISVISSFFCSLLSGKFAPIDFNEATGTNLFDFHAKRWSDTICNFIDANLIAKLGEACPSSTVVGLLSPYFVKKYGFEESKCRVVAFTGDNAASLFASGLKRDDILVTLGSSDCDFFVTEHPKARAGCHIFGNAMNENEFFSLCCFKNSSLARMRVRDECGFKTWDEFDEAIETRSKPGNEGNFGVYFFVPESCPPGTVGVIRLDENDSEMEHFPDSAIECRAILESQVTARLWHAEQSGFEIKPGSTRVLLTGGASKNKSLPQIFADIFQSNVFTTDNADSAAFGSAMRAIHGLGCLDPKYLQTDNWRQVAEPRKEFQEIYAKMKQRYANELSKLLPK